MSLGSPGISQRGRARHSAAMIPLGGQALLTQNLFNSTPDFHLRVRLIFHSIVDQDEVRMVRIQRSLANFSLLAHFVSIRLLIALKNDECEQKTEANN